MYMGTDETGAGDWPIEVLMCVLGYNFYKRCVSLKKVKFGGHKRRKRAGAMVAEAIKSHVSNGFDLIVELQFPTNGPSSHSKTKTDGSASSSAAPGPAPGRAPYEYWRDLPVSPLGERGHFIAVRNGLVFDSAAPAGDPPVAVKDYPLWTHTERVYRLHVCVAGAAPNSSTPTTAAGEGDSDEKKENEGDQVGVRREPGARDREGEEEEREYGEDVLGDGSDYWQDTVDLRSDDDEP